MDIFNSFIIAQENTVATSQQPAPTPEGKAQAPENPLMQLMLMVFIIMFGMWFLFIRPQQREQKKRQAMWDSLRKTDKVVTIGGIHGVITDIDRENDTVTVRVDEDKNVKMTFSTGAIQQIFPSES
ncbi:MAG: preprotein translocase subunit YajC [Planctomycetia bacterium]|nr:preprotein translocase subunit YajC [Planctomycetia bacterium]